ncbi:MAG: hypothetical protein K0S93_404 [Nitrososphaeraceae archaeon]|jgi:hypothetical protein|nr:hypothetical protein [Nitrososphaeraceae archaeon]
MSDRNTEPKSPVSEEKAKEHVKFIFMKNWIGKVPGFENGFRIQIEEKPLIIHDLNGQILFYEYQIILENDIVSTVKASASKTLGSPVPQIQLGARRWDPDNAVLNAKEAIKNLYPNAQIPHNEFVCYSYPKIGVRLDLIDSNGEPKSLIFDVASTNLVDRFGADELPGFSSFSFYDAIIEQDATKGEARWDARDRELEEVKNVIPRMFEPNIDPTERNRIEEAYLKRSIYPFEKIAFFSQKIIQYCTHCSTHDCNALHAQHTDVYCACATGQMILDFYRYYYNQVEIATAMSTGPFGTSISGMVNGIKSLSRYCLDALWDGSASWSEAKAEIYANRPFGSIIPGHARACFGWKRQNLYPIGTTPTRWLYILDPWPWSDDICKGGAVYWEDMSLQTNDGFVYVRHRTTSCT